MGAIRFNAAVFTVNYRYRLNEACSTGKRRERKLKVVTAPALLTLREKPMVLQDSRRAGAYIIHRENEELVGQAYNSIFIADTPVVLTAVPERALPGKHFGIVFRK